MEKSQTRMIKENTIYHIYTYSGGTHNKNQFYITRDRIYFDEGLTSLVKTNKYLLLSIFGKNKAGRFSTHIPNLVFRKEANCIIIRQDKKTLHLFKRETVVIKEINEKRTIWTRVKQE